MDASQRIEPSSVDEVERLRLDLSLTDGEFASAPASHPLEIERWRSGRSRRDAGSLARLARLGALDDHLHDTFEAPGTLKWLRKFSTSTHDRVRSACGDPGLCPDLVGSLEPCSRLLGLPAGRVDSVETAQHYGARKSRAGNFGAGRSIALATIRNRSTQPARRSITAHVRGPTRPSTARACSRCTSCTRRLVCSPNDPSRATPPPKRWKMTDCR